MIDILKDSEKNIPEKSLFTKWVDWYGFGDMLNLPLDFKTPIEVDPKNKTMVGQKKFIEEMSSVFLKTTEKYIEEWDFKLPNWRPSGLSVCRYNISKDSQDLAMTYHTDFSNQEKDMPGLKFGITCTIYLNDDYEGGEISFLNIDNGDVIDYKPKAGDVIVFPSSEPYYHGVKAVRKSDKYFIRVFWQWEYEGSPEWLENEKKYGKEKWAEMEKERSIKEFHSGKYHRYIVEDGSNDTNMNHATPFYKKGYKTI
jgi:hypothetical protein